MRLRVTHGIAAPANLGLLIFTLLIFPSLTKWTDAFSFAAIDATSPQHTPAFLKFCLVALVFEWSWFLIAWFGIRAGRQMTFKDLTGEKWNSARAILKDTGLGILTLGIMLVVATVLQTLLAPYQHDAAAFRSLLPTNNVEASGYLALAMTAGFVEEFVFRGYLQAQFTAMTGNVVLASILQLALFVQGHYYQGGIRLISVAATGLILTLIALWRRSLRPGMIGHALGDGLPAIVFFLRRFSIF